MINFILNNKNQCFSDDEIILQMNFVSFHVSASCSCITTDFTIYTLISNTIASSRALSSFEANWLGDWEFEQILPLLQ